MTFFKKAPPLFIGILLVGTTAFAQKDKQNKPQKVSKKELTEFAKAAPGIQKISMEFKQQAQSLFKNSDLSQQQYQQIRMSKANPQMSDSVKITKKEKKVYEKLQPKIDNLQQKMQGELKTEVKKQGLEWKRFQQIAMALRQSKDLQQRSQKIRMQQMQSDSTSG
jgi:cell division protein FtsX